MKKTRFKHAMLGLQLVAALTLTTGIEVPALAGVADPGWYFGIEGFNAKPRDANGSAIATVTTAPTTAGGCPAGSTAPLGGTLNPLNGLISSGLTLLNLCLIAAPTTTTPGTQTALPAVNTTMSFSSAFGGGFSLGYMFDGGFRPELDFSYIQNDVKNYSLATATDRYTLSAYRMMANAWYDFDFGIPVVPYLGGGVGAQYSKFSASAGNAANDTTFAYQLGGGINFWATRKLALSLDYRYVGASQPDFEYNGSVTTTSGSVPAKISQQADYKSQQFGIGLKYLFGEHGRDVKDSDGDGVPDYMDNCPNTPKGVAVDAHGCPLDADGDGVPDYLDKCPDTPKGVRVDSIGCPLDSDGDGVPDYLDKCPNTPKGMQVDATGCPVKKCKDLPAGIPASAIGPDGCPLDSDGDGVPDYLDECPHTPAGAKVLPNGCALKGDCRTPKPGEAVDANGCAASHNFILKGVKFEFDSNRLTEAAKLILNQVAETLSAYPDINVDVEGHTDYIGSDSYNMSLSERRADAVKDYLMTRGVEGTRMTPIGYGKTRPIASNETEEGREQNRRVELHVRD
jgi:outer membrane protein OmpA-like peptidoglycan-associated protein/opacity protein-like surface antigen